ncbi:hypothetical protein AMATHDRAFT_63536 [Amanita thiersii Skay4041]|uniref:Peptidase S59 domain-containing protein n=1 Tax=Amanita thiersii Skay4041 TaxID=703135 RepID=A0A2A9NGQ4_9AGAR|nr:hypothetical protein AMATHDRAFT_63536 [Amanita thiersii Skay4041]
MFGNGITSSWANPQQNQQQQQPNAFGQSSFGSTGFGSTGAFGQNTQQQPAVNPMFGSLGGTNTTTGNTGFGAFGSNPQQNTSSGFGAFGSKPATGFGAFGSGGSTFGSGGTFGQSNTSSNASGTNIFGQQPSTSANTFGTGGSLFGSKPTSTFGSTTTTTAQVAPPVVTTGTANPPYQPLHDKDTTSNVTLQYQAISCMTAYSGYSFEELRLQDYAQNRKTANAFGQTAFGAPQPTTGMFGQQQQQPQNTQSSLFGNTTTTQPSTGFGAFGQNTNTSTNTGSLFGGGGAFGQQQQQPQQSQTSFGAFGSQPQQQPQQQSGSLFGGGTSTGTFGNTANKPFGSFGGGSTFGNPSFGQQSQQPSQQQSSLFGGTQGTGTSGAFGSFGNKPLFGSTTTTTTQPSAFGSFGQQNQQQQQPQTSIFGGGGAFGTTQQQQPQQGGQTSGPLFGSTNTQQQGGLFGNSNLFNQQNQQQQQQPGQTGGFGSSLFGNKPATATGGGIFGQQTQQNTTQPGLFGSTLGQSTNQSGFGGGLFGNKPAAPTLGSSTSLPQTSGQFTPFGGATAMNALTTGPTQGTLTASISQPIVASDLPITSLLSSGPRLVNLDPTQAKKKTGFFVDVPTRSPVPRVQLGYTPANSRLRGFTTSAMSSAANGNPFAITVSLTSGKPNALSLSKVTDKGDSFVRSSSPSLGSGTRQSVKKVVLDKKIDPGQIFAKSGSAGLLKGGKVTFSPALSVAAREKDAAVATSSVSHPETPTPPGRTQRTPNKFTAHPTKENITVDGVDSEGLEEGDYWVKPDLSTLKKAGYDELSSFEGLVVGRIGYGEVHFLEPVDLTGLSKLGALLGDVVRFEDKECSVYPDSEDVDKPPPGSGLNVKARLILLRCWAVDKASREPIKDASNLAAVKHLKRLKNMKDTHFEDFDISEGKWTFTVDHF